MSASPRQDRTRQPLLPKGYEPRIIWLVIGAAFLGLVGINALWLVPALREVGANAAILRLALGRRAADTIEQTIEAKSTALANAAEELRFSFSKNDIDLILHRLLKEHAEFDRVSILNVQLKEAVRVSRFGVAREEGLQDYSGLAGLYRVNQGLKYRGPVERSSTLEPFMTLAVPLLLGIDGERAVLLAEFNLKTLSETMSRFNFGESGKVYALDAQDQLIIDPDLSLVLKNLSLKDRAVVRQLSETKVVQESRLVNEKGKSVIASGIGLNTLPWKIVSEQDASEVAGLKNRIILIAAVSFGIGLALLTIIFAGSQVLVRLNRNLRDLLSESYEGAKMLVRRDLELTQANLRLEELDRLKSEFVTVAAHQLRTPLAGIKWSLIALLEEESSAPSAEQKKIAAGALGATKGMIELINDLLNVARIEEGRFGFRFIKQSFLTVIEELAVATGRKAEEKGIAFSYERPKGVLPMLMLDGEKIVIALENLLENAVKYTPPGGAITLAVGRQENMVRVQVRDSGIGIPASQVHRVFNKFFRADNALLFQTGGTGLGLYVVKNIIENHGGTVTLESEEGKGTTVTFTLPTPG